MLATDRLHVDSYAEHHGPVKISAWEAKLLTAFAEKVTKLEVIFSRRHKSRRDPTSQLTHNESCRFQRAIYRLLVFCKSRRERPS